MSCASGRLGAVPTLEFDDVAGHVRWTEIADAIAAAHGRGQPESGDVLLERHGRSWLTRVARIDGLGSLTKAVSVYPENPGRGLASVQGAAILFNDATGSVEAIIDNDALTRLKTAADSLLGARFLARPDASRLLVIGAGVVAGDLVRAYADGFDLDRIRIWNRSRDRAEALRTTLANEGIAVDIADDLAQAIGDADVISSATMSRAPLIPGAWVSPGTHVDLVGAYTPEMRESDDALIAGGQVFVDCRLTTETRTGDLADPIARGVIAPQDILGSLYDLCAGQAGRQDDEAITVFKNGGGGHLDLMVARYLYERFAAGALARPGP